MEKVSVTLIDDNCHSRPWTLRQFNFNKLLKCEESRQWIGENKVRNTYQLWLNGRPRLWSVCSLPHPRSAQTLCLFPQPPGLPTDRLSLHYLSIYKPRHKQKHMTLERKVIFFGLSTFF